ncbi:hypothetical protein SDC9_174716 [bioreactor metagenome]|uniref:Uncharacterized protein n=1 Tax=bioreactor metagenome TaxID=1076179 RepID=A0A645GKN3_9ZZZZ
MRALFGGLGGFFRFGRRGGCFCLRGALGKVRKFFFHVDARENRFALADLCAGNASAPGDGVKFRVLAGYAELNEHLIRRGG